MGTDTYGEREGKHGERGSVCWMLTPCQANAPRYQDEKDWTQIQLSHLQTQYVFISPNICSFAFWSLLWLKIRGMKRENITNSKFVSDCLSWNVISVSQVLEGILVDGIPWMNHRIYVRHSWEVLRHTPLPLRGLVNYRRMKTETAHYTVWRPEFTGLSRTPNVFLNSGPEKRNLNHNYHNKLLTRFTTMCHCIGHL